MIATSFDLWRQSAETEMLKRFAITFNDAGITEQMLMEEFETGRDPVDFVQWFGVKFDLVDDAWPKWP